MKKYYAVLLCSLLGCTDAPPPGETIPGRWYTEQQVLAGEPLYLQYCAVCHAADGSATKEWRSLDANGNYPPPPLDGTAHTWHHPLAVLDRTIVAGGTEFGGVMPGFGTLLDESERLAIIAWFQNLWSDDIYARWLAIEERS